MKWLKKLLQKIKPAPKKEKFKYIQFATESKREAFAFFTTIILLVSVIATVNSIYVTNGLKVTAAGLGIGSNLFCGQNKLCKDGHCEKEVWKDSTGCSGNTSKRVIEIKCGEYIQTPCLPPSSL